jgi:hypothetical protein
MTRLRLMRACRSISKGENSGAELSFWDIVSSHVAGRAESARAMMGRGLKLPGAVDHTPRQHVTRECLTADEMSGLKPVLNVFGDFLEIFSKRYGATVPYRVFGGKKHDGDSRCLSARAEPAANEIKTTNHQACGLLAYDRSPRRPG